MQDLFLVDSQVDRRYLVVCFCYFRHLLHILSVKEGQKKLLIVSLYLYIAAEMSFIFWNSDCDETTLALQLAVIVGPFFC